MIKYGRSIRWYNNYAEEVNFSKENSFDFMQVWYKQGEILLDNIENPKEKTIKEIGFPIIFHALLDINEFEENTPKLIELLNYLSHKELIVHPICISEEINKETIYKLSERVSVLSKQLGTEIKLFIENNSKIDPINYTIEDIELLYTENPNVDLLLDLAHIDDYEHLEKIVNLKKPKMLHIADKRFGIEHEHLPIGNGNIDFEYIFNEVLYDFDGKIIFEVVEDDDKQIIESKNIIENILHKRTV